jgi:hypothetical protein
MTEEAGILRIYIDYDYLAAEQLGELLIRVHEIYSTILYSEAPYMRQLPSAPQARLRVDAINTGGSVLVSLVQGVTQVIASSDPTLVGVTSGIAALGATGTIILRILSRSLDVRAKWRRGDREDEAARIQLDSRRLDLEAQRLEFLGKELEFRARAENQTRGHEYRDIVRQVLAEQFPQRLPQQREELADQVTPIVDAIIQQFSQDNIRQVSVSAPDQSG